MSSRILRSLLAGAGAAVVGVASLASAHDFWLAPSSFRPELDERVSVELRVGERFEGEAVPRNPAKVEAFFAIDSRGSRMPIEGIDGRSPAGFLRMKTPGLAWIGYRSRPTPIELHGEKFEAYLRDEGLDAVALARASRGETARPGKEIYSRFAKAVLRAGDGADATGHDRVLGFPLEIVAEADPSRIERGGELPVRVLYLGRPLPGALAGCMPGTAPESEVRLRTDADGRARFPLEASGVHLVRVVHMVPAPADSGAEWESLWASLVFERP